MCCFFVRFALATLKSSTGHKCMRQKIKAQKDMFEQQCVVSFIVFSMISYTFETNCL